MRDLIQQERFEIEVLDRLNSGRFLSRLIFTGGTMLRLCYGLNRFSVDLDFWVNKELNYRRFFLNLADFLSGYYTLTDRQSKFFTLLLELKSVEYLRRLKIEIRKEPRRIELERAIAYSRYATTQVLVTVPKLNEMLRAKIDAFLVRREIRDVFDIEFIIKNGVNLPEDVGIVRKLQRGIDQLTRRDYTVKLGSLLDAEFRKYYLNENFKILKMAIGEILNRAGSSNSDD